MAPHKLVLFATNYSFVASCDFTNKANSNTFEVGNAYKAKLCHFGRPV